MYGPNPRPIHSVPHPTSIPLTDRFWAKVAKAGPNECWLWTGAKAGKGYGTIYVREQRRNVGAHVVSWYLHHGTWPPEGMDVLHNCTGEAGDQPACCNPVHLWLGTHQANMLDKIAKGRDNTPRKVTTPQVLEMCELYATGEWTYKQLAERYGVKEGTPFWIIKKYGDPATIPGRRERAARGERSGNAKLTDAQWQEALALYATGEWPSRRLAARYGVNKSSILSRLKHQR
jgi:HNH endonuclease